MFSVLIPLLYTLLYALLGTAISFFVFSGYSLSRKVWFGLVFGLFGMTWMPSLFSFITGSFNLLSHIFGLSLFLVIFLLCRVFHKKQRLVAVSAAPRFDWKSLIALLPILCIGFYLFSTHILQEKTDGLYVGQTTYGDLAMHLGFISSIATQGTFPPQYSIFPGHAINYPFLCEISASSLYLIGADLRTAYLISAGYAYLLVVIGVFELLKSWLRKPGRAVLATYLFFIGGGFGFTYFLDQTNASSSVAAMLGSGYSTNLSQLLEGYYTTPTNLPELGLRWVNPIVDMLIPQRATLFGWAFLFPCLSLLHEFTFFKKKSAVLPLAILAGGLPLIHTHSFLALGIISAVYCLSDLITHFNWDRFKSWLLYGGIAVLLASPQLFEFTFAQVSESSMVQFHFNWANEKDSWFWFYLKNWGFLFLLLFPGLFLLSKRDRKIMAGPIVLWGLSEIVIFQPNTYDNNKLIFVFFAYLCGLSAKLLSVVSHRLRNTLREKNTYSFAFPKLICLISSALFAFTILSVLSGSGALFAGNVRQGRFLTVLFLSLLLFILSLQYTVIGYRYNRNFTAVSVLVPVAVLFGTLIAILLRQTDSEILSLKKCELILILILESLLLVYGIYSWLRTKVKPCPTPLSLSYAFFRLTGSVLIIALFLSGIMTVAREWVSSYRVFSNSDLAASDFIKEETPADSVFLTTYTWHLNTVSVLTGRNIVCGPDLFLYYHGIDTSKRQEDIEAMFSNPGDSAALFKKYNVAYVYIGADERYSLTVDEEYFENNFTKIYDKGGISIYEVRY